MSNKNKDKADKQSNLPKVPPAAASTNGQAIKEEVATPEETKTEAKAPPAPPKVGKIAQIINHHKAGKTNKEILDLTDENDGEKFHPTTVSIQVTKYKKTHLAADEPEGGLSIWDKEKAAKEVAAGEAKAAKEKASFDKLAEAKAKKEGEEALAKAAKEKKEAEKEEKAKA